MKVEDSKKVGLKLNIHKTKIMASGPITSWEIDGETVETVSDFIFLGSKTTADGDCGHEIKRHLLLGRKIMSNLDSILKSRDITLPTKSRTLLSDWTELRQYIKKQRHGNVCYFQSHFIKDENFNFFCDLYLPEFKFRSSLRRPCIQAEAVPVPDDGKYANIIFMGIILMLCTL